jgi:voltage-gated potassium channel Kch
MLAEKFVIALLMMFLCTLIHAVFMVAGTHALDRRLARSGPITGHFHRAALVWLMTMWMFFAIYIEAALWAGVYLYLPGITELADWQTAIYFSMVTFTTLGYGDLVLSGEWRTLASVQAANGVIMFGWTTALIFYFIQKIYKSD